LSQLQIENLMKLDISYMLHFSCQKHPASHEDLVSKIKQKEEGE